jgi:hypothetical protein
MDRDEYRLLLRNPRLRDAMQSVASRQPPTRTDLEAALTAAGVPDHHLDPIIDDATKLAREVALGAAPFHIRQEADQRTLRWLKRMEAADSLLGDLHPSDDDPGDLSAEVDAAVARRRAGIVERGRPPTERPPKPAVAWKQT